MPQEKEFKINQYLTLKLKEGETIIYVAGKHFRQCKYLFLNIPSKDSNEKITSIDEAAKFYGTELEDEWKISPEDFGLTAEDIFWGHCSNLQVWAENDYDSTILHSNLSFPLLKRLAKEGDQRAKAIYKSEVAERYVSGSEKLRRFLIEEHFLDDFDDDEFFDLVLEKNQAKVFKKIANKLGINPYLLYYLIEIKNRCIRKINFEHVTLIPEDTLELKETLITLKISSSNLTELPIWISELSNLELLRIENCKIKNLPDIGLLQKLKTLIINDIIDLTELPESIGKLKNLESISVYRCAIEELPDSFANLTNLKVLDLDFNKIKQFPHVLTKISTLKIISLYGNPINFLSPEILNLKSLKSIKINEKLWKRQEHLKRELWARGVDTPLTFY